MADASVSTSATILQAHQKPRQREQQLGRRNLLGALVSAPAVAVSVPVAAAEAADPHLEWERQLPALAAAVNAASEEEEEEGDAAWRRYVGVLDQICLTPARTPAGIATQVRLAVSSTDDGSTLSDSEVEGLRNAIRSLEQLGGRA